MGSSNQVDFGGMTLIANTIKTGASAPGRTGSDITTDVAVLAGVVAGTVTASKALVVDSNKDLSALRDVTIRSLTQNTGGSLNIASTTATLSSNAATITEWAALVTSEALTTASGSSQAFVITLTGVAAGDLAFVQAAGGTNTRKAYFYEAVTTTDTVTVTVYNNHASALNGTLKFNLWVVKA